MSFEDLSAVYRQEKKEPRITGVRKDLYPAMVGLILSLRTEYEKCLAADPDSVICEGVNQRRKKAVSLSKEISEIRMGKISAMALIGARGGLNVLDNLTAEEREYYNELMNISKKHIGLVDKLTGKKKYETPDLAPEPAPKKTAEPAKAKHAPAAEPAAEAAPIPMAEEIEEEEMAVIRILEDLPPFSGPDRNYELSKEDIVRMPKTMALALINRAKAELVSPAP